jgi:hypothetical protein
MTAFEVVFALVTMRAPPNDGEETRWGPRDSAWVTKPGSVRTPGPSQASIAAEVLYPTPASIDKP